MKTRIAAFCLCMLCACSLDPADPDGTLDRVRAGTLRVGIAARAPWTDVVRGRPSGIEATLAEDFARAHGAHVAWVPGETHDLIESLEEHDVDLVVAGLTADSPFADRVALTRPYATVHTLPGSPDAVAAATPGAQVEEHVIAAPMGENAFLVALERFLRTQRAAVREMVEAA